MKIQTKDLIGAALDWAVAKCEKELDPDGAVTIIENCIGGGSCVGCVHEYSEEYEELRKRDEKGEHYDSNPYSRYCPSEHWEQGGRIIEEQLINISINYLDTVEGYSNGRWNWTATTVSMNDEKILMKGHTLLVSAMRCYVACELGEEIDVPDELVSA